MTGPITFGSNPWLGQREGLHSMSGQFAKAPKFKGMPANQPLSHEAQLRYAQHHFTEMEKSGYANRAMSPAQLLLKAQDSAGNSVKAIEHATRLQALISDDGGAEARTAQTNFDSAQEDVRRHLGRSTALTMQAAVRGDVFMATDAVEDLRKAMVESAKGNMVGSGGAFNFADSAVRLLKVASRG